MTAMAEAVTVAAMAVTATEGSRDWQRQGLAAGTAKARTTDTRTGDGDDSDVMDDSNRWQQGWTRQQMPATGGSDGRQCLVAANLQQTLVLSYRDSHRGSNWGGSRKYSNNERDPSRRKTDT